MKTSRIRGRFSVIVSCAALAAALVLPAERAEADTISLVGDMDCFGLGGSCPDGSLWQTELGGFFFDNYQDVGDPAFTDKWSLDVNPTYTHSYVLGAAVSATLEIGTAGIADDRGPWDVFFNDTSVGQFAVNTSAVNFQEVLTYSFAIPTSLLTGFDTIRLAINTPVQTDGYSIDYSALTINTGATPVPEPTSLMLLGVGIAAGVRRWWKRVPG